MQSSQLSPEEALVSRRSAPSTVVAGITGGDGLAMKRSSSEPSRRSSLLKRSSSNNNTSRGTSHEDIRRTSDPLLRSSRSKDKSLSRRLKNLRAPSQQTRTSHQTLSTTGSSSTPSTITLGRASAEVRTGGPVTHGTGRSTKQQQSQQSDTASASVAVSANSGPSMAASASVAISAASTSTSCTLSSTRNISLEERRKVYTEKTWKDDEFGAAWKAIDQDLNEYLSCDNFDLDDDGSDHEETEEEWVAFPQQDQQEDDDDSPFRVISRKMPLTFPTTTTTTTSSGSLERTRSYPSVLETVDEGHLDSTKKESKEKKKKKKKKSSKKESSSSSSKERLKESGTTTSGGSSSKDKKEKKKHSSSSHHKDKKKESTSSTSSSHDKDHKKKKSSSIRSASPSLSSSNTTTTTKERAVSSTTSTEKTHITKKKTKKNVDTKTYHDDSSSGKRKENHVKVAIPTSIPPSASLSLDKTEYVKTKSRSSSSRRKLLSSQSKAINRLRDFNKLEIKADRSFPNKKVDFTN